ncbi:hypothetical protein [Actinomadura rayongensis]|uniref:Uncharacterized protein n=1 Tax=Actinomadura rayongensis TaxID=1429076 RepID=A0A6I4WFT0_9ACTN|nr:hypothetical protein [Actinomadura rayongensis]MXQ67720.1 hypothetical protein [Actinomadura rayongensis]
MSPLYPGDRVRLTFPWGRLARGAEATFVGDARGEVVTVVIRLDVGGSEMRVPLGCLTPVSPRPTPEPTGDLEVHHLPGGVRVAEGIDRTNAPRWTWEPPSGPERVRLIWRRGTLMEYRVPRDGRELPTGRAVPTGPTRREARRTALAVLQRRASDIAEPFYAADDGYEWIRLLPTMPRTWRPMVTWEAAPLGHWPRVVVATCTAPPGAPLYGAAALWNAGVTEVTNHLTLTEFRTRLLQIKEAFPDE